MAAGTRPRRRRHAPSRVLAVLLGTACSSCTDAASPSALPTTTFSPTSACQYDSCVTAATASELTNALYKSGSVEIDVTASIALTSTLYINSGKVVSLKSSNGLGELDGGGSKRIVGVSGDGSHLKLKGLRVRDGMVSGVGDAAGGCISVDDGATAEIDGAEISGCRALGYYGTGGAIFVGQGSAVTITGASDIHDSSAAVSLHERI